MALTYKVRGADGKEYGPATLIQITTWLQQGRINPQSEMTRSDITYWAPVGSFSEVQPEQTPPPISTAPATPAQKVGPGSPSAADDPAVLKALHAGASWFYWIAGLSLISSVAVLWGSHRASIVGLSVTQLFDVLVGRELPGGGKAIVLGLDCLVAGVLVLFGVFAYKRHIWAFVAGMALYALDGLFLLLAQDWLRVAVHAFVLFCLFRGFQACRQLNVAR